MRITYKFYLTSVLIGIISGIVCTAFRYLIDIIHIVRFDIFKKNNISDFERLLENDIRSDMIIDMIIKYLILFIFTFITLNIIQRIIFIFPTTMGSGLPQTKALLERKMKYKKPFLNIIAKFFGGIFSIISGLSFGREGSSVQMGSLIAYISSKHLKTKNDDSNYLIAAGAGAGISAAFTAPLASSILILESLRNDNTSNIKKLTISTLLSGLCAGIIANYFFPTNIYSTIDIIKPKLNNTELLFIFLLMASIFAIAGKLFSKLLIFIKLKYDNIGNRYDKKFYLTAVLICIITFFYPSIVGGNQAFTIEIIENNNYNIINNTLILIILILITIISNATRFPGGLFIPLLSIGGLLGKIFCIILTKIDIITLESIGYFVFIGMSVFIISVVRTPLTGFILISEMTGNYDVMFPTLVVGIMSYIITEIIKVQPLDDILYSLMMKEKDQ